MPPFNRGTSHGTRYAFGWFIDDNGFMTGATPAAPANGVAGSGAFPITGIKSAAPTLPEPDVEQVTGDDALLDEYSYDSIESRAFVAEYAVEDLNVVAQMLGVILNTWGEARTAIMDIPNAPERNMGFIFQGRARKHDVGQRGQKAWNGKIIPLATASPLGRASFDERGAAVFRLQITPQQSGYDPFGVSILAGNYGAAGGRQFPVFSDFPLHIKTFRGDGSATTFNLDYQPISASKTYAVADRVLRPVTGVATLPPTATIGSALGLGRPMIMLYEFNG